MDSTQDSKPKIPMRVYAGIGSRHTPDSILRLMERLSDHLGREGSTLRSGGAYGADSAFFHGSTGHTCEIYIPWEGYNGLYSCMFDNNSIITSPPDLMASQRMAARFHPAWNKCSPGARNLHARNMNILLGRDLKTPVDYIICWTEDARIIGGTGQALRAAAFYDIPVHNLGNPAMLQRAYKYLEG